MWANLHLWPPTAGRIRAAGILGFLGFFLANSVRGGVQVALLALLAAARGPSATDRMLVALLFGSTGVSMLVLLAHAGKGSALVDVALILALLATITGIAFAQRAWHGEERSHD